MNTPIEPWKLTAYLLGELESDETEHIRAAIEADASLQSQLQELQSVIGRVQAALQHSDAEPCFTENQTIEIVDQIQLATASNVEAKKWDVSLSATDSDTQKRSVSRFSRSKFVGLAAMAASLLVVAYWIPRAFENKSQQQEIAHGQWAVDPVANDKRVPDSVWIDPNLPVLLPNRESVVLDTDGRQVEEQAQKKQLALSSSTVQFDPAGTPSFTAALDIQFHNNAFSGSAPAFNPPSSVEQNSTEKKLFDGRGLLHLKETVQDGENGAAKNEPTALAAGSVAAPVLAPEASQVASALGNPQPDSNAYAANPNTNWSDYVELQINESLAFHDKRIKDDHLNSNLLDEVSEVAGTKPSDKSITLLGSSSQDSLGRLPAINRLFANQPLETQPSPAGSEFSKATGTPLMLSVTPRIIIPEEEEAKVIGDRIVDDPTPAYGLNAPPKLLSSQLGDRYEPIIETPFASTEQTPLSTFSIDVDTASYSKVRQYLMQANQLPQPSAVRIEEMLNYFEYTYEGPKDEHPFASSMAITTCPWNEEHKLVRIGLQAKKIDVKQRAKANIVFLLDVSGSMDEPNKLPLVKQTISMLVRQLGENDRIAMVVYAGAAGCVLPSITGDRQSQILAALDDLNAGGSTNGGQGIELAYSIAREHFVPGGINRVILCTDGDFNVGTTSNDALIKLVQEQAKSKVFLTCLGFGMGNYNDSMLEQITNQGNGIYGMVDSALEARRMMVEQLAGTLVTVAKDVKIQIEFNPTKIASYRLIGYENRRLAKEDFNNDQKDAGEIGAGHRVTALYEIIPASSSPKEQLRYSSRLSPRGELQEPANQPNAQPTNPTLSKEWLSLSLRYKQPEADVSSKLEFFLTDEAVASSICDADFQWAGAVAEFGLLLRRSQLAPQASWDRMLQRARSSTAENAYRIECLEMMTKAKSLVGK